LGQAADEGVYLAEVCAPVLASSNARAGTGGVDHLQHIVAESPRVPQTQAKSAFDREMAREKAGDCRDTNYQAYAGALRAMLAQKNPYDNREGPVASGPTGKPLTQQENLSSFDGMQRGVGKVSPAPTACTAAATS
jgi:hypothetical protein